MIGVLKYLISQCNVKILSYDEVFNKDGSVYMHRRNVHIWQPKCETSKIVFYQ